MSYLTYLILIYICQKRRIDRYGRQACNAISRDLINERRLRRGVHVSKRNVHLSKGGVHLSSPNKNLIETMKIHIKKRNISITITKINNRKKLFIKFINVKAFYYNYCYRYDMAEASSFLFSALSF